ncbi:hypothetical protein INR49_017720 [Caranx melampygus]|nr:hypothetical protein INR49_017720 [Caranx melampygus]
MSINQTENIKDVVQQAANSPQRHSSICRAAPLLFVKTTWSRHRASPHSETGPHMLQGLPGNQLVVQSGRALSAWRGGVNDPLALLAQPLGVGGILCTQDGQVVLIRRSQRVAEAGGSWTSPGVTQSLSMAKMQQRREAIVSELFRSCVLRSEMSCSLTSDEVRELYWKGGVEAHESTDIVFLSRAEMLQLDRSSTLWSELCPSAKGAVLLYQTVKPDAEPEWSRRPDAQLITSKN